MLRAIGAIFLLLQSISLGSGAALAQAGDVESGQQVFKKCMACHRVGEGAKNLVGPSLNGVFGRQAGTMEGYSYSALNKAAGESGLVWSEALIFSYLEDPNAFLRKFLTDKGKADLAKGSTKMVFRLADEGERRDVIAYLMKASLAK